MIKNLIDKDELLHKYRPDNDENQAQNLLYRMLEDAVQNMPVIKARVSENGDVESATKDVFASSPIPEAPDDIVLYLRKKHNSIDKLQAFKGRGVRQDKNGHWIASIAFDHKAYHLGTYETRDEAAAVREEAERLLWKK